MHEYMMRSTKRGQGQYASELRVSPKGCKHSHIHYASCVWPNRILRKKKEVLLAFRSPNFLVFSVHINSYDISWASLHLKRKNYTKVLMKNAKYNAKYMFE